MPNRSPPASEASADQPAAAVAVAAYNVRGAGQAAPLRAWASPAARTPGMMLALQRAVGNRAAARLGSSSQRTLARCPGCGGTCGGKDATSIEADEELLRRAVVARAVAPDPPRTSRPAISAGPMSRAQLQRDADPFRRGDSGSGGDTGTPDTGTPDAGTPDKGADSGLEPDNPSREQDPAVTIGVCGPDISRAFAKTLGKIKSDFGTWSPADKRAACKHLVYPISITSGTATPDLNGWDIHALFQGEAQWLRRAPVCPPCATPSSSARFNAGWADKGHEDPRTCSDTVQVGNACWLAGTPNYGTFGMMLSLCRDEFKDDKSDADTPWPDDFLRQGKQLIAAYKMVFSHEDPKWPLAWTEAVYNGGATATLAGGNRQSCTTTCSKVNGRVNVEALANWDYVWEPAHPRIHPAPASPSPAPSGTPAPAPSSP